MVFVQTMKGISMLIKEVSTMGGAFACRVFPRATSTLSVEFETPNGEKFYAVGLTYPETVMMAAEGERFRRNVAQLVGSFMRDREKAGSSGVCNVTIETLCKMVERKMIASN